MLLQFLVTGNCGILARFHEHWDLNGLTADGRYTEPATWKTWTAAHADQLLVFTRCRNYREVLTRLRDMHNSAAALIPGQNTPGPNVWPAMISQAYQSKDPSLYPWLDMPAYAVNTGTRTAPRYPAVDLEQTAGTDPVPTRAPPVYHPLQRAPLVDQGPVLAKQPPVPAGMERDIAAHRERIRENAPTQPPHPPEPAPSRSYPSHDDSWQGRQTWQGQRRWR